MKYIVIEEFLFLIAIACYSWTCVQYNNIEKLFIFNSYQPNGNRELFNYSISKWKKSEMEYDVLESGKI